MKILVIGGAGYIGSHVVYELIDSKFDVVVLDDLSTGNKESIHKSAKFYQGDQKDIKILDQIFQENNIVAVIHLSAKLIVPESVKKPIKYFENNVHGLSIVLNSMNKYNVKNIVFSSTAAVYGNAKNIPIKEDDFKDPINPYGFSKLSCEWLIQSCSKAYNINYSIFRYFNVAGAHKSNNIGQSTKGNEITHLIPVVIESILNSKKELQIFGNDYKTKDGTCIRDYIHVSDLAKAHILGLKYTLKNNSGIFNLGSKEGYSVKEVINTTSSVLNKEVVFKISKRRKGDPPVLIASIEKAKKILGFQTSYSLEEIIKSDYLWRKNKKF